jgi:hypothetical protein
MLMMKIDSNDDSKILHPELILLLRWAKLVSYSNRRLQIINDHPLLGWTAAEGETENYTDRCLQRRSTYFYAHLTIPVGIA